jgi:phosphohistidine phosphatase SixA
MIQRRIFLSATSAAALGLWAGPFTQIQAQTPTSDATAFARLVAQGGCAVLIRHAQTESGIGDPPGYRLDNCSSQRQLSAAGRAQSERMGQWFAARQLKPSAVLSSQWCRCKDTASLAFGRVTEWTALNSTFDQSAKQPAQTSQLRERLRQIKPGQFEVWLTHQVNMTDLSREYPAMGEAFVVDGAARLASRMAFG